MDAKPTVEARLNWGQWIADCPVHGEGVAEKVEPGQDFICSRCYPGIHAQILLQHPQDPRLSIPVADVGMRGRARQQAEQDGRAYAVIFPKQREQIEAIVRLRKLANMNWRPGVTLADLKRENKEHGDS